ncbi:MAG: hypothetical protein Q9180_006646, partial [Flavoplaca navasiana]
LLEPEDDEHQDENSLFDGEEDGEVVQDESTLDQLQAKLDNIVIVEANVLRFWSRMEDSIMTLKALVMSLLPFNDIVSINFYSFLNNASVEYLVETYRKAIPLYVQTILGQEVFGPEDLLLLVANWRDPSAGIYLDILTKSLRPLSEWYRLYVGSAARKGDVPSQSGLWPRLRNYWKWWHNRFRLELHEKYKALGYAHAKAILEPDTQIQFAILAKFPEDTNRNCINVLEWLMMDYLQAFKPRRGYQSEYTPAAAFDWAEYCRPDDLPAIGPEIGLNLGFPLKSRTQARRSGAWICANCKITEESAGKHVRFRNQDKDRPGERLLCEPCLNHIRRKGTDADVDTLELRRREKECRESKKRHNDWICDICDEPLKGRSRHVGTYCYVDSKPGLGKFVCLDCASEYGISSCFDVMEHKKRGATINPPKPELLQHPCVACGGFGRRRIGTRMHEGTDKKFRCADCIKNLNKVLKHFLELESGAKKAQRAAKFETREAALEYYCRSEGKTIDPDILAAKTHKPCVSCGRSDKTTTTHPVDMKRRCYGCRSELTRALKRAPTMKNPAQYKEESLQHYSRNDYPGSAEVAVNSPCVTCGKSDVKTAIHAVTDGKPRCSNCRRNFVSALKSALERPDPARAKKEKEDWYSRNEFKNS